MFSKKYKATIAFIEPIQTKRYLELDFLKLAFRIKILQQIQSAINVEQTLFEIE